MVVGVLAFQGDFAEHIAVLHVLRVPTVEVRTIDDMAKIDALIIPGGESTVIAKFLDATGVGKEIMRRALSPDPSPVPGEGRVPLHPEGGGVRGGGLSVFGTCAGAIVLARKVNGKNAPRTLGLIDITIDRNAYGSQVDSFETDLKVVGIQKSVPVAFIRAPKISRVGKTVEVLARHEGDPVLVREGNIFVSTFHPEARGDTRIHALFLRISGDTH